MSQLLLIALWLFAYKVYNTSCDIAYKTHNVTYNVAYKVMNYYIKQLIIMLLFTVEAIKKIKQFKINWEKILALIHFCIYKHWIHKGSFFFFFLFIFIFYIDIKDKPC